jgi:hypothetical protein
MATDLFWSKVKKGPGCWEWQAGRDPNGYGRYGGPLAHRVAWTLTNGDPGRQYVLHRCDNPPCVRPSHLFLGTQQDNLADMRRKGRERHARGVDHGKARLTPEQVQAIRQSTDSLRTLANRYGVSYTSIRYIKLRRNWAWLPDAEAA